MSNAPHHGLITPHGGGALQARYNSDKARELTKEAASLPRINLTNKQSCDLELIANGGYSPLTGFMGMDDFKSVCKNMTLADGTVWSIPILLSVSKEQIPSIGSRVALYAPGGVLQGVMTVKEEFIHDKKMEIPAVFRTEDEAHPGVAQVAKEGDYCIAGPVEAVTLCVDPQGPEAFLSQRLTPAQTREEFAKRGWKTIVAFQTRNPIHRAHEYVCKCAQEICDGLLIHPLVGETKKGDIAADIRMQAIDALVKKYFNPATTMVTVLPAAMRYAGPREAIHHAIMRRNYGCSHFIVGRDHAGVGNYYGTYDAQKIFDEIDQKNLGIVPLKFEHTGYSKSYGGMVSSKTYPKIEGDIVNLSGTAVRELLFKGERPPAEFSRPEVADVLIAAAKAGTLFVP
ncbi:MAG: sulfate adenylyltransferase [Phycisphaeraceae bacterium]|nr:sulfate adenylyltransferase [Phycisphaeraceae bacterium]MCW5754889.1 sulfate adenylyltransferase [Phycisphaeraceae bacterium]